MCVSSSQGKKYKWGKRGYRPGPARLVTTKLDWTPMTHSAGSASQFISAAPEPYTWYLISNPMIRELLRRTLSVGFIGPYSTWSRGVSGLAKLSWRPSSSRIVFGRQGRVRPPLLTLSSRIRKPLPAYPKPMELLSYEVKENVVGKRRGKRREYVSVLTIEMALSLLSAEDVNSQSSSKLAGYLGRYGLGTRVCKYTIQKLYMCCILAHRPTLTLLVGGRRSLPEHMLARRKKDKRHVARNRITNSFISIPS